MKIRDWKTRDKHQLLRKLGMKRVFDNHSLGRQACAHGTGKKEVDRQGPQGGSNTRGHRVRPWSLH